MAFVNEYASEEDISKYDLLNVWRMSLGKPDWTTDMWFKYAWTIDRERSVFLSMLRVITDVGGSGRDEPTNGRLFLFWNAGKIYLVTLERAEGSSSNDNDIPYRRNWNLLKIVGINDFNFIEEDVIALLKEALTVFGADGIRSSVKNAQVKFNF